jgi:hypothetical protein
MATIGKVSNAASAGAALAYADGKGREMKNDTRQWLADNGLPRPAGGRAVAFSGTNGITREHANEQFKDIREVFGQTKPRNQALRIIQSFDLSELDPRNPKDWLRANELGRQLVAKMYPDHQAAVYTHIDGKTHVLHNHIIVNKVNLVTGRKMKAAAGETVASAREINDALAREQGWNVLERPVEAVKDYERTLTQQGAYTWLGDLKGRIDETMALPDVDSMDTFKDHLATLGVQTAERGQELTFRFVDADGKHRARRSSKLGTDYERTTYDGIFEQRQALNRARTATVERQEQLIESVGESKKQQSDTQTATGHSTSIQLGAQTATTRPTGLRGRITVLAEAIRNFGDKLKEDAERLTGQISELVGRVRQAPAVTPAPEQEVDQLIAQLNAATKSFNDDIAERKQQRVANQRRQTQDNSTKHTKWWERGGLER